MKTKQALTASWAQALSGEAGSKAQALAQLMQAEVGRVPPFLALLPKAASALPEMRQLLEHALPNLGQGLFAVRASPLETSSATNTTGTTEQETIHLPSFVNIWSQDVGERVTAIWHHQQGQYVQEAGVLVMPMIKAQISGTAYSADPKTGARNHMVIQALPGLAQGDETQPEKKQTYRIAKTITQEGVPNGQDALLAEAQIREIAGLAQACAAQFGQPQEIEWAIDEVGVWVLQSKNMQLTPSDLYPNDPETRWSGRLSSQHYEGVVCPLSYSFFKRHQGIVWRQWLGQLGILEQRPELFGAIDGLSGLYKGHVYDNLEHWQTVLSVLPAPVANSTNSTESGERLLTTLVGAHFDDQYARGDHVAEIRSPNSSRNTLHLGEVDKLRQWQGRLYAQKDQFYERLKTALHPAVPLLTERSLSQLIIYYRELEHQLFYHWQAPLLNDALALLHYDLLQHLCMTWLDDESGTLQNDLLMSTGSVLGIEPVLRMSSIAQAVPKDLLNVLESGSLLDIEMVMPEVNKQAMQSYMHDFGTSSDNFKLESAPLAEHPLMLWRAVGQYMRFGMPNYDALSKQSSAEEMVLRRLNPLQRPLFTWVLKHARETMRIKANFYIEQKRVFGRVRQIFQECGKRLAEVGVLSRADDVFYLNIEEIIGFAEGVSSSTELHQLAAIRRKEQEKYQTNAELPSQLAVRGSLHLGHIQDKTPLSISEHRTKVGRGEVVGRVQGKVCLIDDEWNIKKPAILVMRRLLPQWLLRYPMIRGLVLEESSPLSEGLILARELGIPVVAGVVGAREWLREGEMVEIDGQAGSVTKQAQELKPEPVKVGR